MYSVFSYNYETDVEEKVFEDLHFEVCKDVKKQMIDDLIANDAYYGKDGKLLVSINIRDDEGLYVS